MEPARAFMALDGTRAAAHALTEIARMESAPGDHDERTEGETEGGASGDSGDASDESEASAAPPGSVGGKRGKAFTNVMPSHRGLGARSYSTDDLNINTETGAMSPVKRETSGIGALLRIMTPWGTSSAASTELQRQASFEERDAEVRRRLSERRQTSVRGEARRRRPSSNSVGGRRPSLLAAAGPGVSMAPDIVARPGSVASGVTGSSGGVGKIMLPNSTGVRVPMDGAFRELLLAGGDSEGRGLRLWGVLGPAWAAASGGSGGTASAAVPAGGAGAARSTDDAVLTDLMRKSKVRAPRCVVFVVMVVVAVGVCAR